MGKSVMPAPWTWVWMLLAVMNLTLGQSVPQDVNDASPKNRLVPELKSLKVGKSLCKKCHLVYPKKEYHVGSQKGDGKKSHNVVFLVEDRKTGRTVKVAFMNGLKNGKGVRVLKPWFRKKGPCKALSKRCVYRLKSLKNGRNYKIDFKEGLKNGKGILVAKLAP